MMTELIVNSILFGFVFSLLLFFSSFVVHILNMFTRFE